MLTKFRRIWNYARRPAIEFAEWETPFKDGNLIVLDVRYGEGSLDYKDYRKKIAFKVGSCSEPGRPDLVIRLFHVETGAVYSLSFQYIHAFRVLDEGGLSEIWGASAGLGGRPGPSTFRVRNHLWAWESAVSFALGASDGWSFVIATDDDCVEIVCAREPAIKLEQIVPAQMLG